MNLDINVIIQMVLAAAIVAVGKFVLSARDAITRLSAEAAAHQRRDDELFAELRKNVDEADEKASAALYHGRARPKRR